MITGAEAHHTCRAAHLLGAVRLLRLLMRQACDCLQQRHQQAVLVSLLLQLADNKLVHRAVWCKVDALQHVLVLDLACWRAARLWLEHRHAELVVVAGHVVQYHVFGHPLPCTALLLCWSNLGKAQAL